MKFQTWVLSWDHSQVQCLFAESHREKFPLRRKMEDAIQILTLMVMTLYERGNQGTYIGVFHGQTWRNTLFQVYMFTFLVGFQCGSPSLYWNKVKSLAKAHFTWKLKLLQVPQAQKSSSQHKASSWIQIFYSQFLCSHSTFCPMKWTDPQWTLNFHCFHQE